MKKFDFRKAVYKYAILLSAAYIVDLIWIYYIQFILLSYVSDHPGSIEGTDYIDIVSRISKFIKIIFHIVFAIMVYKDMKTTKVNNPLLILVTLFFGFIGIALFFIQLLYELHIKSTRAPQNPSP